MSAKDKWATGFLFIWGVLVFTSLCGVTSDIWALQRLKLEQLAMLGVAVFSPILLWQKRGEPLLDREFLTLWLPGLFFLLFLFHAEFYRLDPEQVLFSSQMRHVIKVYVLVPLVWLALRPITDRSFVIGILALGVTVLSTWSLVAWQTGYLVKSTERLFLDTRHGDPNFLATYAGATIFLWGYLWRSHHQKWLRILAVVSIGILISLIIASGSRMGMLSLLCGGFVLGALEAYKRQRLLPIALAGTVMLLMLGLGAAFTDRISDFTIDRSIHERFLSLEAGWTAFSQRPLTGWGVGATPSFFYRFSEYPLFEANISALDLHNTWMQCLAELGVFGLVSYACLWLVSLWRTIRAGATLLAVALLIVMLNMNALPGTYDDILPMFPILVGLVFTRRDYCTTSM